MPRKAEPIPATTRAKFALLRAYFALTLVTSVGVASIVTRILYLIPGLSLERRKSLSAQAAGLSFRLVLAMNPQITVEYISSTGNGTQPDKAPWDELFADEHSRPLVLINHTSTFDSLFYSAMVPLSIIGKLKTLAKSGLWKVPLFGTILDACGHFPVYFTKEAVAGEFSVNKQAQDDVMRRLEEHVTNGGGLSMFPEGQINRVDTAELQAFRRGTFAVARKHNMTIWAFLHTGVEDFWPTQVRTFGGFPSRIVFKLFKVPPPPKDMDLPEYVDHIQKIMQLELDLLCAVHRGAPSAEIFAAQRTLDEAIRDASHGDSDLQHALQDGVQLLSKNEQKMTKE